MEDQSTWNKPGKTCKMNWRDSPQTVFTKSWMGRATSPYGLTPNLQAKASRLSSKSLMQQSMVLRFKNEFGNRKVQTRESVVVYFQDNAGNISEHRKAIR